ncbi:MAG: transglycosylase family protein [bacterium]
MNIRRLLISICATSLLAGLVSDTTIAANAKTVPVEQTQLKHFSYFLSVQTVPTSTMHPELIEQLRTRKAGSVKFWEAVSWCETNHDWNNGGYFSGGLGMAQSVWVNYGGKQFASRPPKATKEEQIIVGNRVSFLGYQTKNTFRTLDDKLNNRPFFRPAIGWRNSKNWGRGCINWETRKPLRERYTEEGMAEWKKTRPGYKAPSGKVSTQSLASDKTKRCPQWEAELKARGLVPVKKFSYIMWRESRCQEKVISKKNSNGTRDYGLLQINSSWRTVTRNVCGGKNMDVLLDSRCNLKVARYLFDNGGIGHWSASSGSEN